MCTLLTTNNKLFNENKKAFINRIETDYMHNSHGCALLLIKDYEVTLQIQAMSIDTILVLLETEPWDRMFLHQRFATSNTIGVSTCHGFYTKDKRYSVMHNGVLPTASDSFAVDSEAIVKTIDTLGIDEALQYYSKSNANSYCNALIIDMLCPETFYMIRNRSGSLHQNKNGNCFSSQPIQGIIDIPVLLNTHKEVSTRSKKQIAKDLWRDYSKEVMENYVGYDYAMSKK